MLYSLSDVTGVFNLRPALPRNKVSWDSVVVLNKLRSWSPAKDISMKKLTQFFFINADAAAVSAEGQAMLDLDVRNMEPREIQLKHP